MNYRDVAQISGLQKLQDRFCRVARVSVCCVWDWDEPITEFSGEAADIEKLKEMLSPEQMRCLVRRVSADPIESQAVEATEYPYLKLAAVSARLGKQHPVTWIVCGIVSDAEGVSDAEALRQEWNAVIKEQELYPAVDLLHDMVDNLLRSQVDLGNSGIESYNSQSLQETVTQLQRQNESMAQIVGLLKDTEAVETVMERLLAYAGGCLGSSGARILGRKQESQEVRQVASWHQDNEEEHLVSTGDSGESDRTDWIDLIDWNREKPLVISYDTDLSVKEREQLRKQQIHALICLPVRCGEVTRLYACFEDKRPDRRWSVEEVKFVRDALNVLESILTARSGKKALTDANRSLETVLEHIGSAVYVEDECNGETLYANQILNDNQSLKAVFGQEWQEQHPDSLLQGQEELLCEETGRFYDVRKQRLTWTDGRRAGLYALHDITETKTRRRREERQLCMDYLSMLYQRTCCERDLTRLLSETKKPEGLAKKGALVYINIEGFASDEDRLSGCEDVILKSLSDSLREIHGIDGIKNTCYQIDRKEAAIIVPPTEREKLEKVLDGIRAMRGAKGKPVYWKQTEYQCKLQIGAVCFPQGHEGAQELIQKAKADCFSGKHTGEGNNITVVSKQSPAQFEVYFQPMMELREGKSQCVGAEALVRWSNIWSDGTEGNAISAGIVPLVEYLGLITPIGNHVIYEACRACREWNEHGHPDFRVSVALSVVQLLQTDITGTVWRILKQTGLAPGHLVLNIEENRVLHEFPRFRRILAKFKKLGVGLVLDGFGSTEQSFGSIRGKLYDGFKIERNFIKGLPDDVASQTFVEMTGELARKLDKQVYVDGIETQPQLAAIGENSTLQGHYFADAMPRRAFEERYVKN